MKESNKKIKNKNIRYLAVTILTLFTALIIFRIENLESIKNELLFKFPIKIGNWIGHDIPMEKWVFESLETKYAILKNYSKSNGDIVNLAIVWYDDREIAFHNPDSCLGGIGADVKEDKKYILKLSDNKEFNIRRIIGENGNSKIFVLYYYISDGFVTGEQRILREHILKKRLKFQRASAAFVRITAAKEQTTKKTMKLLENFFKDTLAYVSEYTSTRNAMKNG